MQTRDQTEASQVTFTQMPESAASQDYTAEGFDSSYLGGGGEDEEQQEELQERHWRNPFIDGPLLSLLSQFEVDTENKFPDDHHTLNEIALLLLSNIPGLTDYLCKKLLNQRLTQEEPICETWPLV